MEKDVNVVQADKKAAKYAGGFDSLDSGILAGWAADANSAEPLKFAIYCNGACIGSGVANLNRPDLKKAGFHEGLHGFKIEVNQELLIHDMPLQLRVFESDAVIPSNAFKVNLLEQHFWAEVQSFHNGQLWFSIKSEGIIGKKTLVFSSNNVKFAQLEIDTNSDALQEHIWLPANLLDGTSKLIEIGMKGYPLSLGGGEILAKAISTPWQYLKDSYRNPGILSLSNQANHRYESLHYHLEEIAKNRSPFNVSNLIAIHNVVVEGYEGRKKFPSFELPKFDKPEVSIIVPAYNKFELTYHCIASIALSFNHTSYEVILADDCSTDQTANAEDIIGNLVVSRNSENLRFLRSCNAATEYAKGEFIIFLNNDTETTSYWIDELVKHFKECKGVGLTGSKLLNLDGSMQEAGGIVWGNGQPWNVGRNANPLQPEYNYVREVDYVSGAAMCIPKAVWEDVGMFSEELAPCYYEDTDLAFKVRDAGFKTLYVPASVVIHFEGQSHGTDVTKGLKRYQVVNEKTFRSKWFKAFKHNGSPSLENLKIEKDRNIDQRVLVIDYASPSPNKDAGSYAAIQEIKLMLALGFKVTFAAENLAYFGKYTTQLQSMGVEVLYAPFYTSMDDLLNRRLNEMDAVYITRFYVAERYLDKIKSAGKPVIFNNADLHFLRELRGALSNGRDEEQLRAALQTRDRELSVCQKVDAILTYNSTEHAVITSHILEAEKLHITPWVLEEKTHGPEYSKRGGIVFLGGFNHAPNVEAVKFLAGEIMPLLAKQRLDIKLYVYGSNMPDDFKDYESDNIEMVGFAEHLDDVFHNHRVFVAPLLSGAGIKGKVLESMAYGLPAVLTSVAAEGTGLTHGVSACVAEKANEFAQSIIELYDDEQVWNKYRENMQTIVKNNFSKENGIKQMKDIFASVGIYCMP
ncbi:MAG: glycosyl transferase [Alteromonadaceae bacterium]|nr:glycosyl transferase [Alteromonadaceae bacterium]MAX45124.1 glycosyl transferase [Alteromonadaceae bacterium]|tara:strand:+ start:7358 stop:10102 length:2745 start_codon:yes stop_codon:yes gene_type:complete